MADEVRLFGRLSAYALVVGTIYWFVSYELAGTVLLLGFGLATGLAFIILFRRDRKVRAARAAGAPIRDDGAGPGPDGPFGDESGPVPTRSAAPLVVGFGIAVIALGGGLRAVVRDHRPRAGPDRSLGLAACGEPRAGPAIGGRRRRPPRSIAAAGARRAIRAPWGDGPRRPRRADPGRRRRHGPALARARGGGGRVHARPRRRARAGRAASSPSTGTDAPWRQARERVAARFPATAVDAVVADFRDGLPDGPFDGVLAANSLHFVSPLDGVLAAIHGALGPGGRLVLVEYDADRGNPWVPHPVSFAAWQRLAPAAGFDQPRLIHRVPSRFLNAIYGSVASRR